MRAQFTNNYPRITLLSMVVMPLLCCLSIITDGRTASAATASNWQAGRIIDDGIFYNGNDMTVDQVQAFLNNQVPTCDTWGTQPSEFGGGTRAQYGTAHGFAPPYICLKNYYENPISHANNLGGGSIPDGSMSAAQIIVSAAQTYEISVRALLATLQKESSGPLITDTWPFPSQYTNAMGYGCPDTAPCDPSYAGFYNQVTNAAHQFSRYKATPGNYRYQPQQNNAVAYSPNSACGSSNVFIQDYATAGLYDYTPYQPNQAALNNLYGSGDTCSSYGNRNFWRIFTDWFGNTILPSALKSPNSATVYLFTSDYKFAVPYMGMLQDYGISPQSIQTVSQSTIDAIPAGDATNNISTTLGSVIKSPSDSDADGGSIYFVSAGKRYQVTSMTQFADFGFDENNIAYLPLGYIQSLPSGGALSNFVTTPYGSVFQMQGGFKHLLLDYKSYITLNPGDKTSLFSYFGADSIPSGEPVSSQPFLIKFTDSSAVYMFVNGNYYTIPNFNTYTCWGFNGPSPRVLSYTLPEDSYTANISSAGNLACTIKSGSLTYILSDSSKFTIPSSYGITPAVDNNTDINQVAALIPTNSHNLNQYIKGSGGAAVWFISGGNLRVIPTYQDYVNLGVNSDNLTILDQSAMGAFTYAGIKLANGALVKSSDNSVVYAISNDGRIPYTTSTAFLAHGNNWNQINTYTQNDLDSDYPVVANATMGSYLYDGSSETTYLADTLGCFAIPANMLDAYGLDQVTLAANPATSLSASSNFQARNCLAASSYVKQLGQSLVYKLSNDTRQPINTFAKLQSDSGQTNPYVIGLSSDVINSFQLGQPL